MELITLTKDTLRSTAEKAAKVLSRGGIVLYPTDTIYGLGVDVGNDKALEKLRALKGREKKKPISLLVQDVESIAEYAVMNDVAKDLARRFMPGPLTLVLPAKDTVPESVTLAGAIGMRIPSDPFCAEFIKVFGGLITTTSANLSGRETPTTVVEILAQFGMRAHDIDLIVDDGERRSGKASSVVSCTADTPYILREGVISREELFG